jgi:hypothetical protein
LEKRAIEKARKNRGRKAPAQKFVFTCPAPGLTGQ